MIAETIVSSTPADTAPVGMAGLGDDGPTHLVSFRLDRQLYALPLDHVERALRMVAITQVPEAPPWVAGVIDLHGRVIPVVDLRQRFGQSPKEPDPDDRLLVVQAQEQTVAFMVDEVTDVLEMTVHQTESPPEPLARSRPLTAVIRRDEGLILVLDATRLLPPAGDAVTQR
jgi:purine-binding chemotaxis protein CheW